MSHYPPVLLRYLMVSSGGYDVEVIAVSVVGLVLGSALGLGVGVGFGAVVVVGLVVGAVLRHVVGSAVFVHTLSACARSFNTL